MSAVFTVLITGSRFWDNREVIWNLLTSVEERLAVKADGQFRLIHGACPRGADKIAAMCAAVLGWEVEPCPALWDYCTDDCPKTAGHRRIKRANDIDHPGVRPDYCPNAGPRRNLYMVRTVPKPDVCFALFASHKKSYGTENCAKLAQQHGIRVIRIRSETS